jgi:protein involved in polysaccharide export with SLBB domain
MDDRQPKFSKEKERKQQRRPMTPVLIDRPVSPISNLLPAILTAALLLFLGAPTYAQLPASAAASVDLIHYGDLIDVDFIGSVEYDWRGSLNPEGFLDGLELASEPVYGLCRSEEAVAADIAKQYSRLLRDPKVVVKVIDRSGRAVALLVGAVKNQQRFSIKREARLTELLALSGGITDTASGEVTILRPASLNCEQQDGAGAGTSAMLHLTLAKILSGDAGSNPVVLSGDIVTVVEASPVYVMGGVNNPRQISSKEQLTLSHAIDAAGGLAKEAIEGDVVIYRRDNKGTRTLSVDLRKVRARSQEDPVLKPYDIIDVGQKGHPKPKFPPAIDPAVERRNLYKLPIRPIE